MTTIEALNKAEENGTLKVLLKNGVIPPKIIFYRELYLLVQKEITTGSQKMVAYEYASDKFRVHINTVKKAVRVMSN